MQQQQQQQGAYLSNKNEHFCSFSHHPSPSPSNGGEHTEYVYVCEWTPVIQRLHDIANGDFVLKVGDKANNEVWTKLKRIKGNMYHLISRIAKNKSDSKFIAEKHDELAKFYVETYKFTWDEAFEKVLPECAKMIDRCTLERRGYEKKLKKEIEKFVAIAATVTIKDEIINVHSVEFHLRKELAQLRVTYLAQREKWAIQEIARRVNFFNRLQEQNKEAQIALLKKRFNLERDYEAERKYLALKAFAESVTDQETYIKDEIVDGKIHYEYSLLKLALRIEERGLDIQKTVSTSSYIDENIDVVLYDGEQTVHAWTIIASGEVQRPHYRYLIK